MLENTKGGNKKGQSRETPLRYSLTFICAVPCVLCVASFSGLFLFLLPLSVFSNICLSCILCTLCSAFTLTSRPYPYVTKTLKLQCHNDLHIAYSDIRYQNVIITIEVLRYYQDHKF
jgi:hypothetical protein